MEAKLFIFAAVAISEVFSACSPRDTKFKNFQKNPKRSKPIVVEVFAKRCPGLHEFYYQWTVQQKNEEKKVVQTSTSSTFRIDGYNFDSDICFEIEYILTVSVSHYPDMTFAKTIEDDFRLEPDFMYIAIVGGIQKGHWIGEDLILDAKTLSRDISYPPNEDAFVGNLIEWKVLPPLEGFEFTQDLVQTIPSSVLKLGDVFTFTVQVTRTKIPAFEDTQTAMQRVRIVPRTTPEVQLECLRNCVNPLSVEATVFRVICNRYCDNLEYKWLVTPDPPDGKITFGNGYDKIIIERDAFYEGDVILVTFLANGTAFSQSLTFAAGLEEGNCTINPMRGISGVTKFHISCKGFSSPFGLARCMIFQQFGEDVGDLVLLDEYSYKDETIMYLPPSDPAYVSVIIEDHAYLQIEQVLKVIVDEFQIQDDLPTLSGVKKLVLSRDSTSITSYSLEGFNNEVVQMSCCLLSAIKAFKFDRVTARDLHKHMVEAITRSAPVRIASTYQRVLILCKLQKYKLKTDTVTARLIGRGLLFNAISAHILYNHQENLVIPHFYVNVIFQFSLTLTSELLQKNDEIIGVLDRLIPPHDYDSYDEFEAQKTQIREDYRQIISDIIVALHTNALSILYRSIPGEKPFSFYTEMLIVTVKRQSLEVLEDEEFRLRYKHLRGSEVIVHQKIIQNLKKKYTFVDYHFAVFYSNPFWWHRNVSVLNTRLVLFDLFHECDKIRNLPAPFQIYLELISVPQEDLKGTMTKEIMAAYKVGMEPHVTLTMEFSNTGQEPYDYLVAWSDCICSEDDFSSSRSKRIFKNEPVLNRLLIVNNTEGRSYIYLCIKKTSPTLSYEVKLTAFACMNWDLVLRQWRKDNCKVLLAYPSINGSMLCECDHASLYAGEAIKPVVSPITSDGVEVTIDFVRNYLTVAFIIGLLLLWLLFLLFAHFSDKSMKKKNVVYKLADNVPGDPNPYLIVVFTGMYYDAQTTADVGLRLIGKSSQSRIHLIRCNGAQLLKRNSQDWFMIFTPQPLGKLKKIQLWHNCKGRYPHWYCDRIIVQDIKIGAQYCFTVKKWFSLIWGAGRIYRVIRVTKPSRTTGELLFKTQFEKDMKDKHMWLSIITRDFQSNFNSKERVSTGFCFLFLSMLANVLLQGVPHNSPTDSIDRPAYTFDTTFVIAFIGSWLAATPMSLLIYYIFKNSAPL